MTDTNLYRSDYGTIPVAEDVPDNVIPMMNELAAVEGTLYVLGLNAVGLLTLETEAIFDEDGTHVANRQYLACKYAGTVRMKYFKAEMLR